MTPHEPATGGTTPDPPGAPPGVSESPAARTDRRVRLVAHDATPALNPAAAAVLARIVRAYLGQKVATEKPTCEPLAIEGRMEGSSDP